MREEKEKRKLTKHEARKNAAKARVEKVKKEKEGKRRKPEEVKHDLKCSLENYRIDLQEMVEVNKDLVARKKNLQESAKAIGELAVEFGLQDQLTDTANPIRFFIGSECYKIRCTEEMEGPDDEGYIPDTDFIIIDIEKMEFLD